MRLRATCHACEKDFLFFELYTADPGSSDRCPRCHAHLGIPNVRGLMLAADQQALALFSTLEQVRDRAPAFSIQVESWLPRLRAIAAAPDPESAGLPPPVLARQRHRSVA